MRYTCKWHHFSKGRFDPKMLVKPGTSSSSSTAQPWQPCFKIDALFILSLVSSLLFGIWNILFLVSDPMKQKSYQTKSIQSLVLNPEVALPLYVKLQPCCRPWRTCHSRKCFSRSKRKSTGLKTDYGPQHVELFHSFWGAFLETCHCLIYVRNTYCVWSPNMHMGYPCVGFNIVFRSFLSQGLYVLEKHIGFVGWEGFVSTKRAALPEETGKEMCYLGPLRSRCHDGIKHARI